MPANANARWNRRQAGTARSISPSWTLPYRRLTTSSVSPTAQWLQFDQNMPSHQRLPGDPPRKWAYASPSVPALMTSSLIASPSSTTVAHPSTTPRTTSSPKTQSVCPSRPKLAGPTRKRHSCKSVHGYQHNSSVSRHSSESPMTETNPIGPRHYKSSGSSRASWSSRIVGTSWRLHDRPPTYNASSFGGGCLWATQKHQREYVRLLFVCAF